MDLFALTDPCTTWCVHVVSTLRIADHIAAGTSDVELLATVAGCDSDSLSRVLRHLVGKGVFEEPEPGHFARIEVARGLRDPGSRLALDLDSLGGRFVTFPSPLLVQVDGWRFRLYARHGYSEKRVACHGEGGLRMQAPGQAGRLDQPSPRPRATVVHDEPNAIAESARSDRAGLESLLDRVDGPAKTRLLLGAQVTHGNDFVQRIVQRRGLIVHRSPGDPTSAAQPGAAGKSAGVESGVADKDYPWPGEIGGTSSAALRRAPVKKPDKPYDDIIADLPRGRHLSVLGLERGWLHVDVDDGSGKVLTGYVSHELIRRLPVYRLPPITITAPPLNEAQAFVRLKRAETAFATQGDKYQPSADEKANLVMGAELLEDTGKYVVDRATYRVSFVQPKSGDRIKINTIEEFILFVETVERTYPGADAKAIVSEIREIWNRDANWGAMVASQGITNSGGQDFVDIKSEPNPIAMMFDMKDIAPKGGKVLATGMGPVTINHVIAGIDASLSGLPTSYPEAYMKARGLHSLKSIPGYDALKEVSNGDVRDFATWAGDLGQAYAEYLIARWLKDDNSASLATFVNEKAPDAQLLGDIHGFIAVEAQNTISPANSPTAGRPIGGVRKVSDVLRDLYLVEKDRPGTTRDYQTEFRTMAGVAGTSDADLVKTITERSLAFGRLWYSKKAYESKGFWRSKGWTRAGLIEGGMDRFDVYHKQNEATASEKDKLGQLVQKFTGLVKQSKP